jgi:tripartite-type tricarboxylate transporter receptor subunit TctC
MPFYVDRFPAVRILLTDTGRKTMNIERRGFMAASAISLAFAGARTAQGQTFPDKPIRWVIPFAAAGNYDVTSRIVGEAMGRRLNQTIVMDNKPGAGGLVGVESAINAPADGYTVVMASFTVLYVAPLLAGKDSLIPSLTPISMLSTVPMVVMAKPGGRFADMKAVMAEARVKPGTVSIGHAGNGTSNHLDILRLQASEKVQFNIIPYKGSGPGLNDLLGGNVDLYMDQLSTSLPHARSGKLKPLAVIAAERAPELPDVPSLKDLGVTPFDGGTTAGLFVKAGTPAAVMAKLNESVIAALKDETVMKRLGDLGAVTRPSTPGQYAEILKTDAVSIEPFVKAGLLKSE